VVKLTSSGPTTSANPAAPRVSRSTDGVATDRVHQHPADRWRRLVKPCDGVKHARGTPCGVGRLVAGRLKHLSRQGPPDEGTAGEKQRQQPAASPVVCHGPSRMTDSPHAAHLNDGSPPPRPDRSNRMARPSVTRMA
jgi:hypothetical protein